MLNETFYVIFKHHVCDASNLRYFNTFVNFFIWIECVKENMASPQQLLLSTTQPKSCSHFRIFKFPTRIFAWWWWWGQRTEERVSQNSCRKKVWKVCRKSLLWCMMASKRRRRRKSYTKKTQILSAWSIGSRHSVGKSPNMSPLNFSIWAFSTDFCPIKIDLSLRSPCWMRLLGRFSTTVVESKRSCYALLYPPGPMCRCQ